MCTPAGAGPPSVEGVSLSFCEGQYDGTFWSLADAKLLMCLCPFNFCFVVLAGLLALLLRHNSFCMQTWSHETIGFMRNERWVQNVTWLVSVVRQIIICRDTTCKICRRASVSTTWLFKLLQTCSLRTINHQRVVHATGALIADPLIEVSGFESSLAYPSFVETFVCVRLRLV